MIRATLSLLAQSLRKLYRREDGTASIEFAIVMPITLFVFLASFESGQFMLRHVMLERGLDMVIRDFRLGRIDKITHAEIRNRICSASNIIQNCQQELKVWVSPINTAQWVFPKGSYCGDGNGVLESAPAYGTVSNGVANQVMYVRVCALQSPLFPMTAFAARLQADSNTGKYQLATSTVVVNEPYPNTAAAN